MEALPSRDEKPNPSWEANFCSRLFFCWLNPLFVIGHKRKLEEDDMYKVLTEDSSKVLGERLQWYWDKEVQKAEKEARTPHLTKAIILCYWKSYLVLGCFTLVEETLILIQPIFLGMIIGYFEKIGSSHADKNALAYAYGSAAALSVCTLILAITHHLYFYHVQRAGMKLRVAMCHMIYHKARSPKPPVHGPAPVHSMSASGSHKKAKLHPRDAGSIQNHTPNGPPLSFLHGTGPWCPKGWGPLM